jgi:hypothetical protein
MPSKLWVSALSVGNYAESNALSVFSAIDRIGFRDYDFGRIQRA